MYVYEGRYGSVAFLANPRTGSKATGRALVKAGFRMHGSHHSGFAMTALHEILPYVSIACVVRNLDDTLASWGRKLGVTPATFLSEHLEKQCAIIEGWGPHTLFPHERTTTHIIRYENLEEEINDWLTMFTELSPVKLEWVDD